MKKTIAIAITSLLLMGCAETVENITLPNGQKGKEISLYVQDDAKNYLSELYLLRKANMFTYVKMKTVPTSDDLYVNIRRLELNNQKVIVYPFSINNIKPLGCTYEDKGKHGYSRECKFSKSSLYASFKKYHTFFVDESGNGKKSASVECLKKHPKPSTAGMLKGMGWVQTVDNCIADAYKIPRKMGSVSLRLGRRELMATNKHYEIKIEDQNLFKQFLFSKN